VLYKVTIRATLIALCTMLSVGAYAMADAPKRVDIPAGELSVALLKLSKQYGAELVYRPEQVHGFKTHGAHGQFTTEQAVTQLLQGTSLELRTDPSGAMLIAPPTSGSAQAADIAPQASGAPSQDARDGSKEGKKSSSGDFRVAQVDQGKGASASSVVNQTSNSQENSSNGLSEIIVTAQKRSERLIDVPISIQSLSSEELEQRQITDFGDLRFNVAGLSENEQTGFVRRIFLRGMSNSNGSYSPLIGVYLDDADVTTDSLTLLNLNAYDLTRVEVLRGPQGTLYGNGAAGGVVRFVTNDPKLDQFDASVDTDAEYTQGGAPGGRVNAMFNVPVIDDQLGVRLASTVRHDGGWIDQPAANQVNINSKDEADVRLKALWTPTSLLTITELAELQDVTAGPNYGQAPNDTFTESFGLPYTPRFKSDFGLYNITMNADLGVVKLTNTTTYLSERETNHNTSLIAQYSPPGTPLTDYFSAVPTVHRESFVDEFRLSSPDRSRLQWTTGAVFRHYTLDQLNPSGYYAQAPALGVPPSIDDTSPYQYVDDFRSKSWAAFVDMNYQVTSRVKLGAGVRYFQDTEKETINGQLQGGIFTATSPRYYVEFELTPRINAYTSATKGFRSGGFNGFGEPAYGPEKVWTYEGGVKFENLARQLSGNVAVFYTNYDGYQLSGVPQGAPLPINVTFNGGEVKIDGIEWDLNWRPADNWQVLLNGDYLNRYNFTRIYASSGAPSNVGDPVDFVPGYTANAAVERDFRLGERIASLFIEYNQQGPQHLTYLNTGPWFVAESQTVCDLNGRAEITLSNKMTVGIYAKNVLDKRALTSPYNINTEDTVEIRQRPRTVGLSFHVQL
jgi:iron complex outermembrane receptor protein